MIIHTFRFGTLKKLFPRADLEPARNPVAAWNYCLKDARFEDERIIKGAPPKPNKNNKVDLKEWN